MWTETTGAGCILFYLLVIGRRGRTRKWKHAEDHGEGGIQNEKKRRTRKGRYRFNKEQRKRIRLKYEESNREECYKAKEKQQCRGRYEYDEQQD
jgi:hypothetical protein